MKAQKSTGIVGILAVFAIALGVLASCDNGTSSTGGNIDDPIDVPVNVPIDVPPESLPVAERWGKWVSGDYGEDPSTATLVYSVDSNGVCTITVGGVADQTRWKANAQYKYTATANTCYAYVFEAWTQSGTRELGCQYYNDEVDEVYIGSGVTLTETPETYTVKGQALPKGGIRLIEFQCADQLGTFYVKVLSIYAYTPSLEYELIDDVDSPNNGTYRLISATGMSGAVEIPATYKNLPVTEIGSMYDAYDKGAFSSRAGVTAVYIPSSVTSIGQFAFFGCGSLTSITFSEGVKEIGWGAFMFCNNLTNITVNANNPNYSSQDGILYNKDKTELLAYPSASGNVTIPANVKSIGTGAFAYNENMTTVTIAAGSQLETIDDNAFTNCYSLASITVAVNNPNYASENGILYNKAKTAILVVPKKISGSLTIPSSVTSIGGGEFWDCSSLTSIIIPASVTFIGEGAFIGCHSLTVITVDVNNPNYTSENGILYNKNKTELLAYPSASGSVTILSSVTYIGSHALRYCPSLIGITFPEGVTEIGKGAFCDSTSLTNITIPASVTTVRQGAFDGWTPSQTIYIRGYASQAAADAAWDEYWRDECNAVIKYWNGSSYQ